GGFGQHVTFSDSIYEGTAAHPEDFDLASIYPGGYTPKFAGQQDDFSSVVGVRSDTDGRFGWDVSFRYGRNNVDYTISETINASLGVDSPTTFKPGGLAQREIQVDAEASYNLANGIFADDILIFGGASYRNEAYEITAGERASYEVGPLRDLPAGSNGFQGFSPDTAGNFETGSYAVYLEAETSILEDWTLSAAGRYENYDAFGDNFSYKVATRYDIFDALAVRGAVSTGFRAPAAGQLFGQSQTSQLVLQDFVLDAVLVPGSAAAQVFGSTPLVPETSFSLSAGLVLNPGAGFSATIDFYRIDVDDRLLLTDAIQTTPAQRAQLAALGYPNGALVEQVRFFRNAIDTRVQGFDIVASYAFDWNENNRTDISTSVAYNEQIIRNNPGGVVPAGKVIEYEEGIPSWRGNLSLTHHVGDFRLMGRGVYYGEWTRIGGLHRDPAVLVDVEFEYAGIDNVSLAVGARNLLNKFPPDRGPALAALGMIYDNHSVFGTSGGYYYARATYNF
ncbi:MAG: TonB-dependent receptor, partial [Amphiplicatus sp.]